MERHHLALDGPPSMVVLWLEGYQNEQRKLKGQLCKRFVCKELQKKKDASEKAPLRERWNDTADDQFLVCTLLTIS